MTRLDVPNARRPVQAGSNNPQAVWTELNRTDSAFVFEWARLGACRLDIPDLNGINRGRDDSGAIGTKTGRTDLVGMNQRGQKSLASLCIPNSNGFVIRGRDYLPSISTEGGSVN